MYPRRRSILLLIGVLGLARAGTRPSFVSDKMIATAATIVNACQMQTGVATTDIEQVRNGTWPDARELKCYMYCLWEQFGLVDEKQELSLSGMLTFFQRIPAYRQEVQKAILECKALGNTFVVGDSCEYAFEFNKCYAHRSPKTYYLF
uniref:Odorant-binding protein 23 n=1 Tax=Encarsia formosa TaxID=32400 RepID=A0A514TTY7_ENCFO|nr:odorant-binding protein 23 [Encarsia formosa]